VGWKWKAEQSQHATGSSTSRFSLPEASAEWGYPLPLNQVECGKIYFLAGGYIRRALHRY
jgi:hypothetical protein